MPGPGLDLDEDKRVSVLCDQVELAKWGSNIGGDDVVADLPQMLCGEGLAAKPEWIDWRRRPPPIPLVSGSR